MEIIINKTTNKKETMDEMYGIMRFYKKLLKNPHSKIIKRSSRLKLVFAFIILYLIFVICISIKQPEPLYFVCLGIAILGFLGSASRMIVYYRYLNINSKRDTNSILKISEEKIELNNKVLDRISSIEWKKIKQILITKNNIVFMPEISKSNINNVIILPRDCEREVIETLEKYNKKDLLVYNKL